MRFDRPRRADQPERPAMPDRTGARDRPTVRSATGVHRRWSDLEIAPETLTSAWGTPGVRDHPNKPSPDSIRLPPDRRAHILDGDAQANGGGHLHGTGRPGKTEFPPEWNGNRITSAVLRTAREPQEARYQQHGTWIVRRSVDSVDVWVIVRPDGRVWTAYPDPDSPGVSTNPIP